MSTTFMTLSEQVFYLLRDRIVSGQVSPETMIRQDALAAELGISRVPIREAFVRLEQEGLVILQANKGFYVSPLSCNEIEEIYALRRDLEPLTIGLGAKMASSQDWQSARDALNELEYSDGRSIFEIGKARRDFLLSLIRPANRPMTLQIVERLNVISDRYVGHLLRSSTWASTVKSNCQELLKEWEAGKSHQAAELAKRHIDMTFSDLREQFAA